MFHLKVFGLVAIPLICKNISFDVCWRGFINCLIALPPFLSLTPQPGRLVCLFKVLLMTHGSAFHASHLVVVVLFFSPNLSTCVCRSVYPPHTALMLLVPGNRCFRGVDSSVM